MISRGIPTPDYPQWGCFEQDQAEALANIGHKVIVLSIDRRFIWKCRKIGITHVVRNKVEYYNCFYSPKVLTSFMGRKVNGRLIRLQLQRLYDRIYSAHGTPDIIYGHYFFNIEVGAYLKQMINIPLIGIEHAGRFNSPDLEHNTRVSAEFAYSMTDQLITVSRKLQNSIKAHFNKDSKVVYNLANSLFFNQKNISESSHQNPLKAVSVGSLVYDKGFDTLIRAISKVKDVQLTIIGAGPEYDNLQNLILELNLIDRVVLVGKQTKENIIRYFRDSDFFVLASRNETFGLVYVEAMALGLPVIGTRCGGPEEIINDNNGVIADVDDIDQLTDKIKWLCNHIADFDRGMIADSCYSKFAPEVIAGQLTQVFEEALKNYSSGK